MFEFIGDIIKEITSKSCTPVEVRWETNIESLYRNEREKQYAMSKAVQRFEQEKNPRRQEEMRILVNSGIYNIEKLEELTKDIK